jgi:hypothetical protein
MNYNGKNHIYKQISKGKKEKGKMCLGIRLLEEWTDTNADAIYLY